MKKILILLAIIIIASSLYSSVPVKYAENRGERFSVEIWGAIEKNSTTLSKIILDEFGERGLLNLLYCLRNDNSHKFHVGIEYDSTYRVTRVFRTGSVGLNDSMVSVCLGTPDFLDVISHALLSSSDTVFIFKDDAMLYNLVYHLQPGKWTKRHYIFLYSVMPTLRDTISDTAVWEAQMLNETRAMIDKAKKAHAYLMVPTTPIPDSLMNDYNRYMR